jgi:hypothetical protein
MEAPVACAYWTDENGQYINMAVVQPCPSWDESSQYVYVKLENRAVLYGGYGYPFSPDSLGPPAGQLTGTEVAYAVADRRYSLDELRDDLPLSWVSLPDFDIAYGDSTIYDLGSHSDGDVIIFKYTGTAEGTQSTEVIQFGLPLVPSLTEWGLLVLAILVVASGVWIVIHRRKTAGVRA